MYTSTSEFTHKVGVTARSTEAIATAKRPQTKPPFVVCSVATKRYAPAVKPPVRRVSPTPTPIATKERLPILRRASAERSSGPGTSPDLVTKAKSLPRPSMPVVTARISKQEPHRWSSVSSARPTLLRKQCLSQPLRITTGDDHPPRPACVPHTRVDRPSAGILEAPLGTQGVTVKVPTTGLGLTRAKPSITIRTARTVARSRTTVGSVKKPVVIGESRTEAPTKLASNAPSIPSSETEADLSPPSTPNLASFSSQNRTIVVDVEIKGVKTQGTVCDPDFAGTRNDLRALSDSIAFSPAVSLSPTVVQSPQNLDEPSPGSEGHGNSPATEPSPEASHTVGAATIISPIQEGLTSSVTNLVRMFEKNRVSSLPLASQAGNRAGKTVQGGFDLARTLLPPLRIASQLAADAVSVVHQRPSGPNVARMRNLLIPPLDMDAKASSNPTTRMEIEMLMAQRKVANGGVVDPRLNRLGSLAAMAVATKRLAASTSNGPSQS